MDANTFLEVMTALRHDFLNHLQVISGLIQLDKMERAREYIMQVSLEMERLGKVTRLMVPEVAAFLTVAVFLAEKHQVKVNYEIDTNMGSCAVPGKILAEVLEEAFSQSLECLAMAGVSNRYLKISATESDKNYFLKMSFPDPLRGRAETVRASLAGTGRKIIPYGGKVEMDVSGGGGEIFVMFPRRLPERDCFGT